MEERIWIIARTPTGERLLARNPFHNNHSNRIDEAIKAGMAIELSEVLEVKYAVAQTGAGVVQATRLGYLDFSIGKPLPSLRTQLVGWYAPDQEVIAEALRELTERNEPKRISTVGPVVGRLNL